MTNTPPFADAHYANKFSAQLTRGFRNLQFDPLLEAEYRRIMRKEQRIPALLCSVIGLIIWIAFGISDIYRLGGWSSFSTLDTASWLVLLSRWAALAGLVVLLTALYLKKPRYDRISLVVCIIIGIATGVTANIVKAKGGFALDSAQILIIMAAFLPIGLTFWQALTVALIIAAAGFLTVLAMPAPYLYSSLQFMIMMPLTTLVAAMGGYAREYGRREQFLLRGVLRQQASTDALTGLANRRMFVKHATNALKQGNRDSENVLLAIVDVDHFKLYNDHYGHSDGDATLQRVASTLKTSTLRPMDLTARVGGEEFGLLLYGSSLEQARTILDTMRERVRNLNIVHSHATCGVVTVSVGVAEFDGRENLDTLYRRADAMLYKAKESGRNRVCT